MLKQVLLTAGLVLTAPGCLLAAQSVTQPTAPNQSPAPPFSFAPEAPKSDDSAQLGKSSADQSLTQRLSQSNGTIQPPPVDPGMNKVPPRTGTMPVLKPSPNVQSK